MAANVLYYPLVNKGGGGGTTPPAAPSGSVQFNNSGAFGGTTNFTWDNSANAAAITGSLAVTSTGDPVAISATTSFTSGSSAPSCLSLTLDALANLASPHVVTVAKLFLTTNNPTTGTGIIDQSYALFIQNDVTGPGNVGDAHAIFVAGGVSGGTVTQYSGFRALTAVGGGSVGQLQGIVLSYPQQSGGTVTGNCDGIYIEDWSLTNSPNSSAIRILNQSVAGSGNYAIYAAGGKSYHAGDWRLGSTLTFVGATSGSAAISVAAIAGTPHTLILPIASGTSGQVLVTDGGTPQQLSWETVAGPGAQAANIIFAGPASGGSAVPTFRALVAADMPAGFGPGGSTTQFQYNSGGIFGGITDLTFTAPHTIAGGASGIFDFSAVSSFKLPVTATQVVYAGTGGLASGSTKFLWANSTNVLTAGYKITLLGSTSGSASIAAAATAGTPDTLVLPTSTGTSGYVLSTDGGSPQQLSWVPQSGSAGSGTVTSVAISDLSPLFTTGIVDPSTDVTVTFTLSTQTANTVFAGPTSGGAAGPTFRSLVVADIPSLPGSIITSSTVGLPYGGTGVDLSASGGSTMVLAQDGSHVISARNLVAADIPSLAASKITTGQLALARGGTNADLSATGGSGQVLQQVSSGAAITVAALGFSSLTGTIALAQTVLTTLGDLLYVNASPALARLAGSTVAAKRFLTQTGNGSISAVPVWGTIAGADITSGVVGLAQGGAATDLSITGGTSRVLRQSAVGAVITVSQLSYTDISGIPPVQASGTVSDGTPIVFDGTTHQGPVTITLAHGTASRNFNVQNLIDGAVYTVIFIQDSTGGAQVVLNTGTTWKIGGNGSGAITLNTTANNQDRFVFQVLGGVSYGTLETQFN